MQDGENDIDFPWGISIVSTALGGFIGVIVAAFGDNQPTARETPAVFLASPMLALAGAVIGFFVASLTSPRLRAATWENPSRRFNWIVLLVGAIGATGIGVAGVLAGDSYEALPWFVIGIGFAAGSVILRLMRLP